MKWETVRLSDVAIDFFYGSMPKKEDLSEKGYPVFSGYRFVGYSTKFNIEKETLVVVARGVGGTGDVKIAPAKSFLTNLSIAVSLDESKVDLYFLFYLLKHQGLRYLDSGAAQSQITIANLKSHRISLPPLQTQKSISKILSAYDDLIENNQKQIKLLEEAAQRLYKEWFIDLRFPGHESTPIHDGIPEGWEKKSLGQIADVVMGQSPKSEYYNSNKEGLPFHQGVGSYGNRFVVDDVYSSSFTRIAEAGSILFSVRAPVGRLNITRNKIVIGRGIAAMNHKEGMQSLLFYMLKERFFKDNLVGNGSIFASISKDEVLGQSFIVPTPSIACQYNDIASAIDKKIEAVDEEILKLTEARDRLLPKLMSGEIEV